MKQVIIIILSLTLLLAGIAGAEEWKFPAVEQWKSKAELNAEDVWFGTAAACTLVDDICAALTFFPLGMQIDLPVLFFVPNSDNWEVNWLITDNAGTVVFFDFETLFITGQSIVGRSISTTLPVGDYTFTAAVIGRGVGKLAVSHQYRFIVRVD